MKRLSIGFTLFFVVVAVLSFRQFFQAGGEPGGSFERTRILMDTLVRMEVYHADEAEAQSALDAAFKEMERISAIFSHYEAESEVSELNRRAGDRPRLFSAEMYHLLQRSEACSRSTSGSYDVSIGAVSGLWDLTGENPSVPDSAEIMNTLPFVDYRKIILDDEQRIGLEESEMKLDLGGAAKGYAADMAMRVLKEKGIRGALVDAGGDIGLLGSKAKGNPWRIGVQHPRSDTELFAVLEIDSGSVATSGDYQRFFIENGRRFHHLLDPQTGWPARRCLSATVVARQALDADMLATGIFVLGPEDGLALLERLPDVEGLIIFEEDDRLEYTLSSGLQDHITFQEKDD